MKNLNPFAVLLPLAALALVVYLSAYTVREDEQSLVLRFGNPIKTENAYGQEEDAGLKFKIPVIETVREYDRKNLELDLQPQLTLARYFGECAVSGNHFGPTRQTHERDFGPRQYSGLSR